MHIAADAIDVDRIRRRLQAMSDRDLERFGHAAAYMASPEASHGQPPREVFRIQLAEARAEWRRRQRSDYP